MFVITIDGGAGSGKSTLGKLFANKIGYRFVDTGLIYRAITYILLTNNIDVKTINNIDTILDFSNLDIKDDKVLLNGKDISGYLRTSIVENNVSKLGYVENFVQILHDAERKMSESKKIVFAGRDMGSSAFPNALLKFYIEVPLEIRAQRRFEQSKNNGENLTLEQITQNIKERDELDSEREFAPLVKPVDAKVIQNYDKTPEESVQEMIGYFNSLSV